MPYVGFFIGGFVMFILENSELLKASADERIAVCEYLSASLTVALGSRVVSFNAFGFGVFLADCEFRYERGGAIVLSLRVMHSNLVVMPISLGDTEVECMFEEALEVGVCGLKS